MITSSKTLKSGNHLYIRTDTEHKGDCSKVVCETTKPASKEDKVEASEIVAKIIADTKHRGESKIEWAEAKARKK